MISFKSERVGNSYIQQHFLFGLYGDKNVSIVKFAPKSTSDKKTLETIANNWKKIDNTKSTFANDIFDDFVDFSNNKIPEEQHYIGLTLQGDSFEQTNPEQVLGLAKVARVGPGRFDNSAVYMLDYLQTRPDSMYIKENRTYKEVGQRLLDFIIYRFKELPIVLQPTKQSANFYLDNGFKWLNNGSDILILRR